MIRFTCPRCKTGLERPFKDAGVKFACPSCQQRVQVPDPKNVTMAGNLADAMADLNPDLAHLRPSGPPADGPAEWYYQQRKRQTGPVTWAQLQQMAGRGVIGPADMVWCEGMPKWVRAADVDGLIPGHLRSRTASPPAGVPMWDEGGRQGKGVLLWAIAAVLLVAGLGGGGYFAWKKKLFDSAPPTLTSQQIFEQNAKSVARLQSPVNVGSGFLVRSGILVTNAHVINSTAIDQYTVYFPSAGDAGKAGKPVKQLLYKDNKRDLAVLALETDLPPLTVAQGYSVQGGQAITVIGSPLLGGSTVLENTVSSGVMGTQTTLDGQNFYQLSIAINGGNSGGPAFDPAGRVIGVASAKATKQEGIAFAIPAADLEDAIKQAEEMSKEMRAKMTAQHNLEVVYRRVTKAGNLYAEAMGIYAAKMQEALKDGKPAKEGVKAASLLIDKNLMQLEKQALDPVSKTISQVTSDQNLADGTRTKLSDLFTNYKEMKSYIDQPRGNVDSYVAKTAELTDKHKKLVEGLKLMTGIDVDQD